jgi:hypothetical protein
VKLTLDDALRLLPGIGRFRTMDAGTLRTLLSREPGECTWCGNPIGPRRQSWCGDECVKAFQLRCDQGTFVSHVSKRANGKCEQCGHDTVAAENEFRRREEELRGKLPTGWKDREAVLSPIRESLRYARGRWREVDHTVEVCRGGGLCTPDGLRLLCGACHKEKTDRMMKERKKRKST